MFWSRLAVAVAQCLLVISEDNPIAWRVLNNFAQDIVSLVVQDPGNEKTIVLRTVAASILSNVPGLLNAHINQIFETLNQALDVNHRTLLGKITSMLPLEAAGDDRLDVDVAGDDRMDDEEHETDASARRRKQDLPTEQEIEIKHVGWILEAQRIAAETITNLCSSEDNGTWNSNCSNSFLIAIFYKKFTFSVFSIKKNPQFQKRQTTTMTIYPMWKVCTTTNKTQTIPVRCKVTNFQSKS